MISELIRKPTKEDVDYLIKNIRDEDQIEIVAAGGVSIEEVIGSMGHLIDQSYVWEVNGEVICLFGITPDETNEDVGIAWLLSTKGFNRYAFEFAGRCKDVFNPLAREFKYIYNYIHEENKLSIKWLKWLGFDILPAEPIGNKGANFHKFEMINV